MAETKSLPLPFAETPVLELQTTASDLELVPIERDGVPRIESRHDPMELGIGVKVVDGVVQLRFGPAESGWRWLKQAHAGLTLYLPKNVRARIRNDMGSVRIQNLDGCDLDVSTSAGQLRLEDVHGRLKLHADAGEIRADHVGGSLDVSCNAGSAKLSIDHLDAGEHHVRSSMGSVKIDLTTGLQVRIDAHTVMGSTRVRYPSTADAAAVLKLDADLGSVKVNDGGTTEDPRHGDWADWRKSWADKEWAQGFEPIGPAWERWAETARAVAKSVFQPPAPPVGSEELRRILSMVEAGKINASEAEKLIRAIEGR
jgi:hypothetical protein